MREFKVGDRIETTRSTPFYKEGETGTVVAFDELAFLTINFDDYNPNRYPYDGLCKDGHGALVGTYNVKKINISKQSPRRKNNLLV